MTVLTPTASLRFLLADLALDQPDRVLLCAPILTGGAGTPLVPTKLVSVADAVSFFGGGDGVSAVRTWFALGMQTRAELWAFGIDGSAWTANTWTLTVTGPATESGTLYLRYGAYTIPVSVSDEDTAIEVAASIAAAVTAFTAPVSAAQQAPANDHKVDLTSEAKGVHVQRTHVSIDLYSGRGEPGVAGIAVAIANNADSTGTPTFDGTNLTADFTWIVHPFHGTAWLDALTAYVDGRWDTKSNYVWAVTAINAGVAAQATAQAAVVTLAGGRNDRRHGYFAVANSPREESQSSIELLATVYDLIDLRGFGIGGQDVLINTGRPTFEFDAETILQAGATPVRPTNSSTRAILIVNNRRQDDEAAEDLRQFHLAAILRTRETGNRLLAVLKARLSLAVVANGTVVTADIAPFVISEEQLRDALTQELLDLRKEAIVFGTEDAIKAVIQSVTTETSGGIVTGFSVLANPRLVYDVTGLSAIVTLQ